MSKGIVLKLFILTTALCMLILATIFIGQTIFFKQYYANRKVSDIQTNISSFEREYLNSDGNTEAIQKLEQDFYRENNTWITALDSDGNLKHATDFYFEVKLDRLSQKELGKTNLTIPLYYLMGIEEVENEKMPHFSGLQISVYGMVRDSTFVPAVLNLSKGINWSNKPLDKKINEIAPKVKEEKKSAAQVPSTGFGGTITKVQLPDSKGIVNPLYKNTLFLESIKEFQADLLLNENKDNNDALRINDYEKNDIKYKLLIKPIKEKDGSLTYIFAMASLQPVDEAVQMVKDYYVYIIAFVLVLTLLASFYYSKQIAKPLLRINDTTKKIAHLDFSERIPITSKDEIGDLSNNINILSNTLHTHIEQLEQDIEKERKL
ncbi:HAMP domain-containing protein, partial [Bacillus pseudomycoides]